MAVSRDPTDEEIKRQVGGGEGDTGDFKFDHRRYGAEYHRRERKDLVAENYNSQQPEPQSFGPYGEVRGLRGGGEGFSRKC